MAIVVKRVKGKLYVYDQYRVNGRVKTFYIGPLEEMARIYQIYKSLGKVEKLSKRGMRRLARILLDEYMKRVGVVNLLEKVPPPGFEPGFPAPRAVIPTGVTGSRGPHTWPGYTTAASRQYGLSRGVFISYFLLKYLVTYLFSPEKQIHQY